MAGIDGLVGAEADRIALNPTPDVVTTISLVRVSPSTGSLAIVGASISLSERTLPLEEGGRGDCEP